MYIIENADIYSEEDHQVRSTSIYIKNNSIFSMKKFFTKDIYMKMNVSPFVMTPTHIMLDMSTPNSTFKELKQYYIQNFLLKGCNTIISSFRIQFENEFDEELYKKRVSMLNSPVDYVLGIRLPVEKLTMSMIRKCKKAKLPIIFIELKEDSNLQNIPWGWIRESMFPYNPILVPLPLMADRTLKKSTLKTWKEILEKEKIPCVNDEIPEKSPINIKNLKKFGLYPKRGDLRIGGEINYNLYFKNKKVAEQKGFHYDNDSLAIMVHKGLVTTIVDRVTFRPGYGEEIIINRTSLFV